MASTITGLAIDENEPAGRNRSRTSLLAQEGNFAGRAAINRELISQKSR
jgi:hypothetical protein